MPTLVAEILERVDRIRAHPTALAIATGGDPDMAEMLRFHLASMLAQLEMILRLAQALDELADT